MISVCCFQVKLKPKIKSLEFLNSKGKEKGRKAAVTKPEERVTTAAPSPRWPPSVPGPQMCPSAPLPPHVDGDDDDGGGSDQQPHLDSLMREQKEETAFQEGVTGYTGTDRGDELVILDIEERWTPKVTSRLTVANTQ